MTENKENKETKIDEVSVNDAVPSPDAAADAAPATSSDDATTDADEQIEQLTAQVSELTDKYLRTAAELENTRRRAALDIESSARNRAMAIVKKFLPVMDAIDAAAKHNPDDEGIRSMALAMDNALAQIGVTKMESVGQILNPQFHNAVQVVDAPSESGDKPAANTIIEEVQPGYMFGDTVLRAAMVVVCK